MVLWCKSCNALIGLREPLTNWSTDRNGVCPAKEIDISNLDPENDTAENMPLPTVCDLDVVKSPADSDEGPLQVVAASD